jgi:hypothetical protein
MISLNIQDILGSIRPTDILAIALLISIFRLFSNARSRVRTTKLKGPISDNLFVGVFPKLGGSDDPKVFLDETLKEFGTAFSIPMGFGRRDIVVCDAKGAAHILARDTFGYQQQAFARIFLDNMVRVYWNYLPMAARLPLAVVSLERTAFSPRNAMITVGNGTTRWF